MNIKNTLLLFLLLSSCGILFSQIPIGVFRSHLPYNGFKTVAAADDVIYAANAYSLMIYDKTDNEFYTWSKVDGLSDIGIAKLKYSRDYETLIVVYENANIDFITNGKLTNMSDIKNKQIIGSKSINNLYIRDNLLYLSFPFGVVIVDLQTKLITDTWFTTRENSSYSVLDFTVHQNRYYLSTERGIFSIAIDDYRVANFSSWRFEEEMGVIEYPIIQSFADKLYANKTGHEVVVDSIFVLDQQGWHYQPGIFAYKVRSIDNTDTELLVCDWDHVKVYNQQEEMVYHAEWVDAYTIEQAREAVLDMDKIWIADEYNGLGFVNRTYYFYDCFSLDGPCNATAEAMDYENGKLVLVPGSRRQNNWAPSYIPPLMSKFEDEKWTCYQYSSPENNPYYDFTNVAINPRNSNEYYIASWGTGLFKVVNDTAIQQFTSVNSPLMPSNGNTYISGLCFDNYNNLWITNSMTTHILKVFKSDGTWQSYNLSPVLGSDMGIVAEFVFVDSRNYKWITIPRDNVKTLIAFYDNNTLDDKSDDKMIRVAVNAVTNVSTISILCITEDKDGEIWFGTDQGVKVIYNPANIFEGNVYPQNILLEQNGYVQNLLEFETITDIAVDDANRKWIGTSKAGVFLMSESGTEELLHFTTENSPILSDNIKKIVINNDNGEVFFSTENGVISYRGTATKGKENYDEALVYPNPVHSGYTGIIAVKGLMDNSFCKICDASGQLIWQGYSKGGQLTWDGKDSYGKRPATGVYFVFASDKTGKEKKVAKILFIK